MEQLNLEVTQSILRERHDQVVRDAETRRMLQQRRAAAARTQPATVSAPAAGPIRQGVLARIAERLHLARRRPAMP